MKQKGTHNPHSEIKRRRKGHRRKNIMWEYNADGQEPYERIKGFWKRYWKKWLKREQEKI